MAVINSEMRKVYEEHFSLRLAREYGASISSPLRQLLSSISRLYNYASPEGIVGELTIFIQLDVSAPDLPPPDGVYTNLSNLIQDWRPREFDRRAFVQVTLSGELKFWKDQDFDNSSLASDHLVYRFYAEEEFFVTPNEFVKIINPSTSASIFSVKGFRDLDEALDDYSRNSARTSQCKILASIWYGGEYGPRLFLNKKPESTMRDSLRQHLDVVLRGDAEVRPEQNVDESHPVDLKITFRSARRVALVEIKWLGKSLDHQGQLSTEYSASRARDGAKQLAEYLDWNMRFDPQTETIGYLVIFDARRRRLAEAQVSIAREDGLAFRDDEIDFNPKYHCTRPDFARPLRVFLEPVCQP